MRRLSMSKRSEAQEAFNSLALYKSVMKIGRSLQTSSISHCLARRLRKAFDCFKMLLSSVSVYTAINWYRRRLLSVMYGKWLAFAHSEQHIDQSLCEKGASLHNAVSLRRYQMKLRRRVLTRRHHMEKAQFGAAFCAYLRLLTSFEKFSRMISMKRSAQTLMDSGDSHDSRRKKSESLAILSFRAQASSRSRDSVVTATANLKHRNLRKTLLLWQYYILERRRRRHRTVDQDTQCKYEVPLRVGIQGPESSVWCVKSYTRAIAALKKFSMKRDFMAIHKRIATQHGGFERPHPSRLLTEGKTVLYRDVAESQAVVMSAALHRWADWSQKRLPNQPIMSTGEKHWKAEGRYTCLTRVVTALQRRQKRAFIESRRFSLATLSLRHGLLREGLDQLTEYTKKKKLRNSSRMTADFRFEMIRFATGFSALRKHIDHKANLQMAYMKAAVVWKVTRSLRAIRAWGNWVLRKREKRAELLASGRIQQQNVRDGVRQLWLTIATNNIYKEQAQRVLMLAKWVVKKWKAYIQRTKFHRQRKILFPLSNSPLCGSHAATVKVLHTAPVGEVNLVKARPRTLDSSTYGCFHVPYSSSIILNNSGSSSSSSSSCNSSSSSSNRNCRNSEGHTTTNSPITSACVTYGLDSIRTASMQPTVSCGPQVVTSEDDGVSRHRKPGDKGTDLAYVPPRTYSFSTPTPHKDLIIHSAMNYPPQPHGTANSSNDCNRPDVKHSRIPRIIVGKEAKKSSRVLLAEEIVSFVLEVQSSGRIMLPVPV